MVSSSFDVAFFFANFLISLSFRPPCLSLANLNQSLATFSTSQSVAAEVNRFFLTKPFKIKKHLEVLDPIFYKCIPILIHVVIHQHLDVHKYTNSMCEHHTIFALYIT
jgi:hypothetical protein